VHALGLRMHQRDQVMSTGGAAGSSSRGATSKTQRRPNIDFQYIAPEKKNNELRNCH
jgi:hypothetical protein